MGRTKELWMDAQEAKCAALAEQFPDRDPEDIYEEVYRTFGSDDFGEYLADMADHYNDRDR